MKRKVTITYSGIYTEEMDVETEEEFQKYIDYVDEQTENKIIY